MYWLDHIEDMEEKQVYVFKFYDLVDSKELIPNSTKYFKEITIMQATTASQEAFAEYYVSDVRPRIYNLPSDEPPQLPPPFSD